jgi:uncharacterized protein YcfL
MKKLIVLVSTLLLIGCDSSDIEIVYPQPPKPPVIKPISTGNESKNTYKIIIDSVLTTNGYKSLQKDLNGYYHLKLLNNVGQQSHRITGRIFVNDKIPTPVEKVEWESNLYWYIEKGQTIASITKTYINLLTGKYTIINLPNLIANQTTLVPTINPASYSNPSFGTINTIISPIGKMIGDTMVVKTYHYESKIILYTKIVLE